MDIKDVEKMLEEAKPFVIESLKKQLADSISYDVKYQTSTVIQEHVQAWVKENVLPEITTQLIEAKDGLVSVGVKLAKTLSDTVAEQMTAAIQVNMAKSWERKKLFDALLG